MTSFNRNRGKTPPARRCYGMATGKTSLVRRCYGALLMALTMPFALAAQEMEETSSDAPPAPTERAPGPAEREPDGSSTSAGGDDAGGVGSILDALQLGSDAMDWRGKQFNLGDAEMAQARFEKYLNSPPSTSEDDLTYDAMLTDISHKLIGKGGGTDAQRVAEAWRML